MSSSPPLPHGFAVNMDMAYCAYLSYTKGTMSWEEAQRVWDCMDRLGLPRKHPYFIDPARMHPTLMKMQKTQAGMHRVPVPLGIGQYTFRTDITADELREVCQQYAQVLIMAPDAPTRSPTASLRSGSTLAESGSAGSSPSSRLATPAAGGLGATHLVKMGTRVHATGTGVEESAQQPDTLMVRKERERERVGDGG